MTGTLAGKPGAGAGRLLEAVAIAMVRMRRSLLVVVVFPKLSIVLEAELFLAERYFR